MKLTEGTFEEKEVEFRKRTGKNFEFFYKKYYPKLIFFTQNICNDKQKAEDITNESFMSALEKISQYHSDKSQFSTWLFTIARNMALQELKNDKKSISIDMEYDNEGTTMKDFIRSSETEDLDLNNEHDIIYLKSEIMKKSIYELKEPYRTVIIMRELQKMQYKDIAEKLDINLSTIKSRIKAGRRILIENTKKEFEQIDYLYT